MVRPHPHTHHTRGPALRLKASQSAGRERSLALHETRRAHEEAVAAEPALRLDPLVAAHTILAAGGGARAADALDSVCRT